MVALIRDFHVFTSRITASLSAVFISAGYIAKARHVRSLFGLSWFAITIPSFRIQICLLQLLKHSDFWRSAVPCTDRDWFEGILKSVALGVYVVSYNCMQLSKRRDAVKAMRCRVVRLATWRELAIPSVNRLIVLSAFGRVSVLYGSFGLDSPLR